MYSSHEKKAPIHIACEVGDYYAVLRLLSTYCNIEEQDIYGKRAIHYACENGNIGIVQQILNYTRVEYKTQYDTTRKEYVTKRNVKKCQFEAKDKCGKQAIHYACQKNNTEAALLLISRGCYLESYDKFEKLRPIHYACKNTNMELVRTLLDKKCNSGACDKEGRRPIHYVCREGHLQLTELFLKNKFSIDICDKRAKRPIHYVCDKENIHIFKLLLIYKCKIEEGDQDGRRPIHYVCEKNNTEALVLLLDRHCDIEIADKFGKRPIHTACEYGATDIFKCLVNKQCFVTECDNNKKNALHYACEKGNCEIVQSLLEKKCDIDSCDKDGRQAIHFACKNGLSEVVELLIYNKCIFDQCDKIHEKSPIHYACENGEVKIVKILLDNNSDFESGDKYGKRPIHHGCENGNVAVVRLLLDNQCNTDERDKNSKRPIDYACESGNVEIVKILLENHCDIGDSYQNLMKRAQQMGFHSICTLLSAAIKNRMMCSIALAMSVVCEPPCSHASCFVSMSSNDFKKEQQIGEGSFGVVYRSYQFCRQFAMKSIQIATLNSQKKGAQDVQNQINKYKNCLQHSRIVQYFGITMDSVEICLFMEYIDGGSIAKAIAAHGSLPHQKISRYCKQILEGLSFLHARKVVHGNIKPSNILMDSKEEIKLADYGLISLFGAMIADRPGNNYMAPETIKSRSPSFLADIWSLGVTIMEMITGQPLFDNAKQIVDCKTTIDYAPINPMSNSLKLFVDQMIRVEPKDRSSADELLCCEFILSMD